MKIIKLNATDSTNSFLREMAQNSLLESFTIVVADEQTNGRGQMGSQWYSQPGKNLLCSVFVDFENLPLQHQVLINFAVSKAIANTLTSFKVPKVAIKWPNDILSSNNKICGILVENVIQKTKIKSSIIGIGLNVNQIVFPDELKNVTSIKSETKTEINLDELLERLIAQLKLTIIEVKNLSVEKLKREYLNCLYKKNIPTMFKNCSDVLFMGKIIGVSSLGKLQVELEDESIQEFGIKEISFA